MELTVWLDERCGKIANPPKPDDWRSRFGVFNMAVHNLLDLPCTAEQRIMALQALCLCADTEGVAVHQVAAAWRKARRTMRRVENETRMTK